MSDRDCLIVGASHAGVSLALALRKEGWEGGIKLIGAENELPYHRPPLSKEHLAGKKELDAMRLRPLKVYEDNAIELLLGTTVYSIDKESKTVKLQTGETLGYDKLALCTGASVRKLSLGQGLDRVHYLRTAADVGMVKPQLEGAKHVAIIGGGYIGLEAAAVLRSFGLEVTVVEMAERVLSRVTSEVLSDFMTALHMMHGVSIKTSSQVAAIREGDSGQLVISCKSGEDLLADFVMVGVGVNPNTTLAETAGLAVGDGIIVDEYTRCSDPDIFAAGDCTQHPNAFYKKTLRLESVQNANDQARVAAANICGQSMVYDAVPWFWSDQYDVKLQMAGINEDYEELIVRGDPQNAEEGFAVFYLKNGKLVAADCVKRPKEFMVSKQLIAQDQTVDSSLLKDESSDPVGWR
ncbi:MAG: FAD-dependent oxidoreductase [Pseudomonadales bacterium]|nr:FAD-dependent oxidoreductase [Pseudomonadales bacterium]